MAAIKKGRTEDVHIQTLRYETNNQSSEMNCSVDPTLTRLNNARIKSTRTKARRKKCSTIDDTVDPTMKRLSTQSIDNYLLKPISRQLLVIIYSNPTKNKSMIMIMMMIIIIVTNFVTKARKGRTVEAHIQRPRHYAKGRSSEKELLNSY